MVGKSNRGTTTPFERELLVHTARTSMLGKAAMTEAERYVVESDMTVEQLDDEIQKGEEDIIRLELLQVARRQARSLLLDIQKGNSNGIA